MADKKYQRSSPSYPNENFPEFKWKKKSTGRYTAHGCKLRQWRLWSKTLKLDLNFGFSGLVAPTFEPRHDKTNKMSVRPAKTQISLGIRPAWSESSLCAQWVAKDPTLLQADSEDSDQTGRMPRLSWVFAGRTATLLVLSCRGSFLFEIAVRECDELSGIWLLLSTEQSNYQRQCFEMNKLV